MKLYLQKQMVIDEFWSLLNLGIGGYVVGRSAEKVMKEYKK